MYKLDITYSWDDAEEGMEDFFSDWCSIGYSRTEARKLMHGGHGEFMKLPDGLGYIRFVI